MHYKYPRTFHFPWSPGATKDDKILTSTNHFKGRTVVVTEKMDGENCTMYSNHIHARSVDSNAFISQDYVRAFWGSIRHNIPENVRICGEDLYAKHSIHYTELKHYFYGFSLWEKDRCLDWESTMVYFALLDIVHVPILHIGEYNEDFLISLSKRLDLNTTEGYVVRLFDAFHRDDFSTSIAKFVRKGHVETDEHWKHKKIIPNRLKR